MLYSHVLKTDNAKMVVLRYLIFSAVTCSVVSFSEKITNQLFDDWQCSRICTDPTLVPHMVGICLQTERNLQDRYPDRVIRTYSACKTEISIEFQIEQGRELLPGYNKREVGMCYLSPTVTKCLTKGSKENSVFIYSYTDEMCHDPQRIDYDFSDPPYIGFFITIQQFTDWKCSTICTESALEKHVKAICLRISKNVADRYDDNIITTNSECKNEITIEFEIENGGEVSARSKHRVGMCYMNTRVTKCITKGSEENTVLVYSYLDGACLQPEQMVYDFSTTPSTDKAKIEFPTKSISSSSTDKKKEGIKSSKMALSKSSVGSTSMTKGKEGLFNSVLNWVKSWWFRR